MRKLLIALLLLPSIASADVWKETDKTMADLLDEGFNLVAFHADSGVDVYSGRVFRFVLQKDGEVALCRETPKGKHHRCYVVK